MHQGGRALVASLYGLVLAAWLGSFAVRWLAAWRRQLAFVLLCVLLAIGAVSGLKQVTTLPCPHELAAFGGSGQWVETWRLFDPDLPRAECFPAGHASGGYAWLCLAFLFPRHSRHFRLALLPGALLGVGFGLAQQLRGAHFLSHDLMTIALCWLVPGLLAKAMQPARGAHCANSGENRGGCAVQAAPGSR